MNLLVSIFHFLSIALPVLVNVAFITLLERKVLAGSQIRTGPMKNGFLGLFQPFADVVKLFSNQLSLLTHNFNLIYLISPVISLVLAMAFLSVFPLNAGSPSCEFSLLFIMMILSLNVYPLLLSGWASNSTYAFLGSIRGVAQTISYEISLALIMLSLLMILPYMSLNKMNPSFTHLKALLLPIFVVWTISVLAELNRTPFDFSEGESELVSGFNVEYGAVKFAMFFMAEYMMIISLSMMTSLIFTESFVAGITSTFLSLLFMSIILWARATYPRYRYDLLMLLAWKNLLPWSLGLIQILCMMDLIL